MTTVLPDAVERSRVLVDPALRAAVDRLHPSLARIAAYHRGWVEADGSPGTSGGGKALRPALALLGARAARTPEQVAVPAGVAVELVHDFSLLHDDVMDGDTERRHRPTAWTVYGAGRTMLAGDGLLAVAYQLVDHPAAQTMLASAVERLVDGQAGDLEFEQRLDVDYPAYVQMAAGKTGALLGAAAALGACAGGATVEQVAALQRYGEHVGLAFQLVDDLLGIWGDPAVTGKPVLSDVRSRKKSAPIVLAAAQSGVVRDYLAGADADPADVAAAIEATGARDRVRTEVATHVAAAGEALAAEDFDQTGVAELLATADYVTGRDR